MQTIKNARMQLAAVCAALCLMAWAVLGFGGIANAQDYNSLADGTYTVNVSMRNAANPSQLSMSDKAVTKPVTVTVKDGKYSVTVKMHGIEITLLNQTFFGYLKQLSYWNGASYQPVAVNSTYDVVDDYNKGADGKAEFNYPKQMTFPLVNKANGDQNGYVKLQVFVPIMEGISAGTGTQQALMKIDWSTLKKANAVSGTNVPGGAKFAKVTSGKVTYQVSGKVAKVVSVDKKAKSASIKSTVKIGGKTYKVTGIAAKAAYNAKKLTKITLGNNIKTIGKNAFKGIAKKATIKAPKAQLSRYKKLCKAASAPKTVKYKAA